MQNPKLEFENDLFAGGRAYVGLGCVVDERHELREDEALEQQHLGTIAVVHDALRKATTVVDLVNRLAHIFKHMQDRVSMLVVNVFQLRHQHPLCVNTKPNSITSWNCHTSN